MAMGHHVTDVGPVVARVTRGKVAGAYLHADDCVDEEQHGDEEGDIWKCLQERACN